MDEIMKMDRTLEGEKARREKRRNHHSKDVVRRLRRQKKKAKKMAESDMIDAEIDALIRSEM